MRFDLLATLFSDPTRWEPQWFGDHLIHCVSHAFRGPVGTTCLIALGLLTVMAYTLKTSSYVKQ